MSDPRTLSPTAFEAAEPGRGRGAQGPAHIPAKGWKDIAWRVWKEVGKDRIPRVAGGVAFFALLALFPALGVFVSLYGLVADVADAQKNLAQIALVLPPEAVSLVGDQMMRLAGERQASLSAAFGVSLLLSLWSANSGMKALFDGLNIAYDEREKRGFVRLNLVSLAFTVGAMVFVAALFALMVAVPAAIGWFGYDASSLGLYAFGWLVTAGASILGFDLIYRFGPSRAQPRWRWVTLGGAVAALTWMAASVAFSFYASHLARYAATYGSLAAVIGFMVWMWLSAAIILLGAELNSEIEHQTAVDTTTGAPLPMGARGAVMADSVGAKAGSKP